MMATPTDADLFGQGIAFPPRLDADGRFGWAIGHRSVRDAIRIILTTEPGERIMLPNFGAGLRAFLFEPNIPATHRLIEEKIDHALRRWEPRVAVGSVLVAAHPDDPARATVSINYTLVATQTHEHVELAVPVAGGPAA
ncbi:Mlr6561 protein [Rhodococcus aetherivorans]|uniref:Mlr6561 protein n=2 Tax=Rhodococcus aetherivorans TaxID=191292 RepID=A0ABQ0YI63_9NOCA|nr:Mlr6561 protein [Rhodococcus aetherivorans]